MDAPLKNTPQKPKKTRNAFIQYFANIGEAFLTLAKGLKITVKTFFQKPYTVQYPDVNLLEPWNENDPAPLSHQVSDRFRGFLVNDIERCISCRMCANTCPVQAITIDAAKYPDVKGFVLKQYDINYAQCIYCGLCVEVCPPKCLTFTREFEHTTPDLAQLYRVFVTPEDHARLLEKAKKNSEKKA